MYCICTINKWCFFFVKNSVTIRCSKCQKHFHCFDGNQKNKFDMNKIMKLFLSVREQFVILFYIILIYMFLVCKLNI